MGPVDNSEIVNLYQKSIIYVQLSDTETFGLSVAEAMSCETPVVVSKMGALPELLGDIGIFVDHNDVTSVSIQILNILNMTSDERKRYGKQLRNRILSFYDYKIRKEALSKICLKYIK
jgi:glycosyltransferase involved in cell wall biosynthesis